MSLVEVRDLRVELTSRNVEVVSDINFDIAAGEVVGLVGESGSGKTTVGAALLGDVRRGARIAAGEIVIDGASVLELPLAGLRDLRGRVVSYIPQDPSAALNPGLKVGAQLREMFEVHRVDGSSSEERIAATLEEVGLPYDSAFLKRFPHQLSGGQQQRALIAMAFLLRPRLIVLDEPTTGLDVTTQARVLDTVKELCLNHQVAALYVTHDLAVVGGLADRILVMYAGRIIERGPAALIFGAPSHPYTRRLIAASPVVTERRDLAPIEGQPPPPGQRPSGCAFHTRCPDAIAACSEALPPPLEIASGHIVSCIRARDALRDIDVRIPRSLQPSNRPDRPDAPLVRVVNLGASYGTRPVLKDISFDMFERECVAVVGESGSGKTTLARSIVGLHQVRSGVVQWSGARMAPNARERSPEQRRELQYIFQNPYSSLNPRRTIGQILRTPLDLFFRPDRRSRNELVAGALDRVALSSAIAARYPDELSGGERQRVAIARALICRPRVLICDEITSALDVSVQATIVKLLARLQREEGLTLLFVTHNLALVRTIADRVITLLAGEVVESGDVDAIMDRPQHKYTKTLINDTPKMPTALHAATATQP